MKKALLEQFVRRKDHVVWKVIEDKGVLLNLEDGAYFEVDPVGLAIWERCDGRTRLGEIAESLSEEYDQKLERVSPDVTEFVRNLRRRGIADLVDQPAPALSHLS